MLRTACLNACRVFCAVHITLTYSNVSLAVSFFTPSPCVPAIAGCGASGRTAAWL